MYHVVNKPRLYIIRLHPKDQAAADGCHCGHTLSQLGVRGPSGRRDGGVGAAALVCEYATVPAPRRHRACQLSNTSGNLSQVRMIPAGMLMTRRCYRPNCLTEHGACTTQLITCSLYDSNAGTCSPSTFAPCGRVRPPQSRTQLLDQNRGGIGGFQSGWRP
jgi:hypothetical protein